MDTINNFAQQLEGLPGYDMAVDWINDKAGEKYQTKDPFYVEIHGKKKRRKAPETCSKKEQKAWKKVKKKAWLDDKNFFGCYPVSLGFGLAPLLSLVPVIGPLLMFAIHGRLVSIADQEFHLPPSTVTKMHGNIVFDLLISLPPIIGSLFSWMNGCSARNAAMVHTFLVKRERAKEEQRLQQMNINTNAPDNLSGTHSFQAQSTSTGTGAGTGTGTGKGRHQPQYQPQRPQQHQPKAGNGNRPVTSPNGLSVSQPQRAYDPPTYTQVSNPATQQKPTTTDQKIPTKFTDSNRPPASDAYYQGIMPNEQVRGRQI